MHSKDLELFKAPLHEVLAAVIKQPDRQVKIEILRRYNSPTLKAYLTYLFDPVFQFTGIPTTSPRYKSIYDAAEAAKLDSLFEAHYQLMPRGNEKIDNVFWLTTVGRGTMDVGRVCDRFIQIVSQLHPKDIPFFTAMVAKKPPEGITRSIVGEAFPILVTKWAPEVVPKVEKKPTPEPVTESVKRGRGRPRKTPEVASKVEKNPAPEPVTEPVKRGRGRPRKTSDVKAMKGAKT